MHVLTFDSITAYERLLVGLLEQLKTAQLRQIVPGVPRFPVWWHWLLNPKRTKRRHFFAMVRNGKETAKLPPRPPLRLADLWASTETSRRFRPLDVQGNDIAFDEFHLSFRVRRHKSFFYWYYVAFPNGNRSFRPIAHECSLRFFAALPPRTVCDAPGNDDFKPMRVKSKTADPKSRPRTYELRIPTVLTVYLPTMDGDWELIVSERNDFESIIPT